MFYESRQRRSPGAIAYFLVATIGSLAMIGVTGAAIADQTTMTPAEISANTARDGEIAICEQYIIAVEANTIAAYELFIARYPDHVLAERARERIADLGKIGIAQ